MKYPVAALAIATGAVAQSCATSASSTFQIAAVDANATISSSTTTCNNVELLTLTLTDGVLTDAQNRTGYIASNNQFQFDSPVQSDAIVDSGFAVCDGVLALNESTTWWKCWSGDFANLYDQKIADQCEEIKLVVIECGEESDVSEDVIPICEIGDGQIQAKTTVCGTPATTTSTALPTGATDAACTCGTPTTVTVTVDPNQSTATEVSATEAPTPEAPTTAVPSDTAVVPSAPAVTSQTSVDPVVVNSTSVAIPTSIATGSVPASVSTSPSGVASGSVTTTAVPSTTTSPIPVSGGNRIAVGSLGLVAVMFALI